MSRKSYWLFVAVIVLTVPFISAKTSAALEVPPLHGRINDLAGILSPTDTSDLNQKLAAIEAETTNQIAILIIPSLNGDSIEEFSIRVARTWALGQKNRNNGVLIVMSVQDRAVRIEVGYGLEGALTDAQSSYIIRNIMVPAFRQQQYAEGLSRAVDAIAAAIAGEFKAEPKSPNEGPRFDPAVVIFLSVLFLAIFALFTLVLSIQPLVSGLVGAGLGFLNAFWLFHPASLPIYFFFGLIGFISAIMFYYMNASSSIRRVGRGPTFWSGGSRGMGGWGGLGGGGFSGGGGGFSGGGGSFGGGGASGRW